MPSVVVRSFFCGISLVVLLVAATAFAQEADDQALRDYNATAALQNSGRYARASDRWKEFIAKYPSDQRLDKAHYYLGISQLHLKKFSEAAATFRTTLTKFPKSQLLEGAQFNLGMALLQLASQNKKPAEYKSAADAFKQAVSRFPKGKNAAKALYLQGEALFSAGDHDGSIAAYQKLIAEHANSGLAADAYYAMGTTQQEAGRDEEAVATFKAFMANKNLAQHSVVDEIGLRLAISLFQLKKFSEADAHFAKAAGTKDFEHADYALLKQAQCRMEQGKYAEALPLIADLLKKFQQSPYRTVGLMEQGKCQFQLNRFQQAVSPLQQAVQAGSNESAEAAYWLGKTQLKLKKPQEAATILQSAAQKHKESQFLPYLQLTEIDALYEMPERRAECAQRYGDFSKQHAEHPLAAVALYKAARANLEQEKFTEAQSQTAAFLANPKLKTHEVAAAVLYIGAESHLLATQAEQKGDLNLAKQLYEQLVQKYPDHQDAAMSRVRIGWCLFHSKQYEQGAQALAASLGKLKGASQLAEAHLVIGNCRSAAGQHGQALAAFDAAAKADPAWSRGDEVLLAAAHSARSSDDPQGARQRLEQLLSRHKESALRAQATYQLGDLAQRQQQHKDAITRFEQVVKQFPKSEFAPAATYGQAASQFALGKYDESLAALKALSSNYGESDLVPRGSYLSGLSHQRLGQFEPAVSQLQAFLTTNPPKAEMLDARYTLGLCQIGLKQFDAGVETLKALVTEHSDYAGADKAYYEMAHAQKLGKKPAEAVKTFRLLVEKHAASPLAAEGWFHLGRLHEDLADAAKEKEQKDAELTRAITAFTSGLKTAKSPELREKLQYKLGDLLLSQEKYAEASDAFQAQLKEFPSGELAGSAAFLAGETLFRQEKFEPALGWYEQVISKKVETHHAQALYRAGSCAGNLKNWPVSQQHYQALIQQFPKFALLEDARYGLGWALQNQRKFSEARQMYGELKSSGSQAAAKARFMLGEIDFEEKKYDDAVEHFLYVAVSYPFKEWQALARFEAGRCYLELGDKQEAIKSLKIVVDKYSDHPKAKSAAALIAEINK